MPPLLSSGRTELVGCCFAHTLASDIEAIPGGGGCRSLAEPRVGRRGANAFCQKCDRSTGVSTLYSERHGELQQAESREDNLHYRVCLPVMKR